MGFRKLAIFVLKRLLPLLVALIMVACLLFFLFFDSLAQAVLDEVDQTVPGNLSVNRFSPTFSGLKMQRVKWFLDNKDPVVEASEIQLDLRFRELFSSDKTLLVERAKVIKPRLRVVVDPNGNLNLLSLLPATAPEEAIDLTKIRAELEVEGGWVLYNDRRDAGFLYQLFECSGSFALNDGRFLRYDLSGKPSRGTDSLSVESGENTEGQVGLHGLVSLSEPDFLANCLLEGIQLESFAGYPGFGPGLTLVRGVVDGSIRGTGQGADWNDALANVFLVGAVELKDGVFRSPQMPATLEELGGKIELLGSEVSLNGFKGKVADIAFEASGELEIGVKGLVTGHVKTERFELSKLQAVVPEAIPVTGSAEVEIDVSGTADNALLSGRVQAFDVEAQGQSVERASAKFFRSGDLVHLSELSGTTPAGTVNAEGWLFIGPDPRVILDVSAQGANPAVISPGLAQSADFDVRLMGTPQAPVAYGSGRLSGLGEWGQGLSDAAGSFLFSGNDILLYNGRATSGTSAVELPFGALDIQAKTFAGILRATDFLAKDVPGLTGVEGSFTGSAVVDADLSQDEPQINAQAVMSRGDFRAAGMQVNDATAEVAFDGYQLVVPRAQGRLAGGEVTVSGTYDIRNQGVQAAAKVSNFELGPVGRGDFIGTVQGHLDSDLGLYGVAESAQGKVALSGFQRKNGRIGGVAWLAGRHQGTEIQSTLVAQGTVDNLEMEYNGHVSGGQVESMGPLELFGSAALQGAVLKVKPTLVTALDSPSDHRFYPLTTYRGAAYSFFGPLMSSPLEKVIVEESPFPKARSFLVAGQANLENGALDLGFEAQAAGLEELPYPELIKKLPFEVLSGFGSFSGSVTGTTRRPVIEADFLFPWLMLGDAEDRRLTLGTSGRLALADNILRVNQASLSQVSFDSRLSADRTEESTDGLLNLRGYLGLDESFDLRVKTDGFSPSFFAFFAPDWAQEWVPSGKLATDSLHLWGTLNDPSISGQVALRDGGLMVAGAPYPINSAHLDFSSQGQEIKVSDLGLTAPGIKVTGQAMRRADGRLSGHLEARDIELERLHRFGGVWAGLGGELDLVANLDGKLPQSPLVEIGMLSSGLSWNPKVIGGRDQSIPVEHLLLGHFDKDKNLMEGATVALDSRGVFLELPQEGFRFKRSDTGLSVGASGAITLPGTGQTHKTFSSLADFLASPYGPDFGRQGTPFHFEVDGLATTEVALLLGKSTEGAELSTSFALDLEGQWWRDHQLAAGDKLPHYNLAVNSLQLEGVSNGKRSGVRLDTQAELKYQREGDVGYLALKDWQFGFFGEQEIEVAEGEPAPTEEERLLRQGVIDAEGRLAITSLPGTNPRSEFNLGAADIPLANLGFLLPSGIPFSGLVESLEVDLAGSLPSPNLSIAGLISDLAVGPLEGMRVQGSVIAAEREGAYSVRGGQDGEQAMTVTFGDVDVEEHLVRLGGHIDFLWQPNPQPDSQRLELFAKYLGLSLDSPLNLKAEMIDKNLDVLASLVPGKETTAGDYEGKLVASGTLRRPEFEGRAVLENGRFDSKRYGRFENLQLDANLNRITKEEAEDSEVLRNASSGFLTRLSLDRLEGTLGNQPFFGGGKAEFAGIAPTFLKLFFVGESLPVKLPELFVGQADVDLEINGKVVGQGGGATLRPSLSGLFIFPEGEFDLPLGGGAQSALASAGATPNLPLDVEIDLSLGKEFFVEALNSRVRTVGDLKLVAKNGPAQVFGQVELSRGLINIPFYDASFRVRQGLAIFDGPFIPTLEAAEAVADLGGYRITARANGRYPDTLKLDLYSDPPLPQAELNRVAVLGGLPSQFSGATDPTQTATGTLGTLSNQGVSFLSGILTNRLTEEIGKIFFLSELSFDYIPPATYAIKIAKALDPDDSFLLTVTRIIRDSGLNENLFGIEWRFTNSLLVRGAFDQLARPRFWFQSINRF